MRHARRDQRLSRPQHQRDALLGSLVRNLVQRGQIQTTFARAKEAQRLADRLITLGKEGSIHARRRAFRILQNRTLVKQLFGEIAPRYVDVQGGYTRVMRLALRRGDGAQRALLALSRLPAVVPAVPAGPKAPKAPQAPGTPAPAQAAPEPKKQSKGLFEGLRNILTRGKKGGAAS